MKHYLESIDNVCADAQSSVDGLSSQQAQERLEKDGKNKLAEGKKEPIILRFLKQFIEPMTLILIVAAIISGVLTAVNNASSAVKEFPSDVIIIMAVVIINAILGVAQESKAEKAIDALQKIAAATSKVIRDGKIVVVKSEDLVVGDVIVLEAGDAVPADARIIECASMKIEEAALTGESVPVLKTCDVIDAPSGEVPLGDRKNMAFMGSTVVYGRGKAIIVGTGMEAPESDVMSRPPRNSKDGIFANGMGFAISYQGVLITLITIASYFIGAKVLANMHHAEAIANGLYSAETLGSSMAFLTLSMAEIFHAFNMRSLHGSIFKIKKQNWWLWGAGVLSLLLTTLVVEVPFLANAFELAKLDGAEYGIAIALAISIIPMVEIVKAIARAIRKKKGIVLAA